MIWNSKDVTADVSKYLSAFTYTDREEGMADDATFVFDNSTALWSNEWYPTEGDTIEAEIIYNGIIKCGLFQVDEVTLSGVPDMIEIKAIAAGMTKALRTRNSKAFEKQSLKQIAQYFCKKHSLKLVDNNAKLSDIQLERKTQDNQTDLAFLYSVAKEYGFMFSIRADQLIFLTYEYLDSQESIKDLDKSQVGNYSITEKTYDTYQAAIVQSHNKKIGKAVPNKGYILQGDTYVIRGGAKTTAQAEAAAKSGLFDKNKLKQTATISNIEGDTDLHCGVNFNLTGFGQGSGKYHVMDSTHSVTDSGYTISLNLRKTGLLPTAKMVTKK